ncbi:hypothetical protein A2985_00145 [Candidatus Woesebacteria bacterium RIFCSPLOWO2_01_FULL_43_11]|uniref:Uncharacterized protein n=1 Tax=Candidatus Woesebacteria bacterium RBG_16_42_24 TaxID=1802485 RepID=A0A1F7XKX6_9BACT|nr:MAG: hypothetical protein A2V48_00885 [Candidatus Amesbacteria bacterium RBG_19FT_COMBO_48_16]OGM15677.1 MAG: hypothetical protein A2V97_02740 [Candidatus Woesebacteria bacterium RBG_16_42_24]OGM66234.1 MAG: hypothetical protein A2985_00145 [Candidatus Woesebacteria bacterium RIFCSPLOWO2_01_FULL_43_11]
MLSFGGRNQPEPISFRAKPKGGLVSISAGISDKLELVDVEMKLEKLLPKGLGVRTISDEDPSGHRYHYRVEIYKPVLFGLFGRTIAKVYTNVQGGATVVFEDPVEKIQSAVASLRP